MSRTPRDILCNKPSLSVSLYTSIGCIPILSGVSITRGMWCVLCIVCISGRGGRRVYYASRRGYIKNASVQIWIAASIARLRGQMRPERCTNVVGLSAMTLMIVLAAQLVEQGFLLYFFCLFCRLFFFLTSTLTLSTYVWKTKKLFLFIWVYAMFYEIWNH